MVRCKITVVKRTINPELADRYCRTAVTPCECFNEGQEFVCGLKKPENFCDWAWRDIHPFVAVLLTGGNFSRGTFNGWMKDDSTMIGCCTDGIRPVIFRIERINE
ncbi:MAG TPA: TIGR04076 family protein [Methanoregulaceae archaeon]|nr:TIGR04076 family protein [Methanoregulaceae archaeon]HPD75112.1 TIGR04076 family protein [Methanoregulaceae archaeon]HRY75475.1 TIGR04076 family protein [Methanoregulaceae archaeon]